MRNSVTVFPQQYSHQFFLGCSHQSLINIDIVIIVLSSLSGFPLVLQFYLVNMGPLY